MSSLALAPAGPAGAYEQAGAFSAAGTATLPSGVTVSITIGAASATSGSSEAPAAGSIALGKPKTAAPGARSVKGNISPAFSLASVTSPPGLASAPAMSVAVSDDSPIDSAYRPVGTLTVKFSRLVHNARLHLLDLGSSAFATRLVVTSGPPLVPRAGWTGWTVSSTQIAPSSLDITTASGCGPTTSGTPRGCGTVQLLGTASSVTFRVDAARTTMPDATTAATDAFDVNASIDDDLANAAASYGGAAHALSDLTIGSGVTADNPTVLAGVTAPIQSTDSGNADVTFPSLTTSMSGHSYAVTVPVSGVSAPATLAGWIDVNANGVFDPSERAVASVPAGATTVTLQWASLPTVVPGPDRPMRLRLGYDAGQVSSPTGYADSGEVEDHTVDIGAAAPSCVDAAYALSGSTLASVNLATGALTPIGPLGASFTSLAVNPLDHLIYALSTNPAGRIAVIDPTNGATLSAFTPTGGAFPTLGFTGGTVGPDGTLYLIERESNTLVRVDLDPATPGFRRWSSITFTGAAIGIADLAVNPVDKALYVIDAATHRLSRIDGQSGKRTDLGAVAGTFGTAEVFDSIGNLYDIGPAGQVHQIDLTGPANGVKLGPVTSVTSAPDTAPVGNGMPVTDAAGCVIADDFGDAPTSYEAPTPPRNSIQGGLALGADVDAEPGPTASDDQGDGRDDDDAFATFPPLDVASSTVQQSVPVTNQTGSAATLAGWIDVNGNGVFDPSERATASVPAGATTAVLTWAGLPSLHIGQVYARLRLFGGTVPDPAPTGPDLTAAAPTGEVEDYQVRVHQLPAITSPSGGALLSTRTPVVSGTAEPGGALTVTEGANVLCATTVTAAGTWACTPLAPFDDGPHLLRATSIATDGDHQAAAAVTVAVDATPPSTPAITAPDMDAWVATGMPQISGTGETASTITVRTGTTTVCTAIVVAAAWSCTPATALADGPDALTAVATDGAGNAATSAPVLVNIDTSAPPAPVLTSPVNGATVRDAKPVLSGTGEPADTVTVADATGGAICAATVSAGGTWTCTATMSIRDGAATLTPTTTDLAGHSTPGATSQVTVDTTAPPAAVITSPRAGSSINTTAPTITGTGESGNTVTVRAAALVCSTIVSATGTWSCHPVAPMPAGVSTLTPTQVDPAGNSSVGTGIRVLVDTTPPPAPVITSPKGGSFVSATRPVISGSGEIKDTIIVTVGLVVECSATVTRDGAWSCVPTDALPSGASTLIATAHDQAGNATAGVKTLVTVDTTPPRAAVITTPANGSVTNNVRLPVAGTGEPLDTIDVTDGGGGGVCLATVSAAGSWSCSPSQPLADGQATLTATATDRAGNVTPGAPTLVTIDTTPPPPAVISRPAAGSYVATHTPTISGSGEPADAVTVADAQGNAVCTATVAAAPPAGTSGAWTCTASHSLADGSWSLMATATDPAGNSAAGAPQAFTIDTTAPAAPVVAAPANGSVTNKRTVAIKGTGEPTDLISVHNGPALLCTAHVVAGGIWSCASATPMADGVAHLSAVATDRAGNTTTGAAIAVIIDATPPPAATITDPAVGSTVFTATPVIHGIGEVDDTILVETGGGGTVCLATVQSDRSWSCPVADPLPDGPATLNTVATDVAGNQTTGTPINLRVDAGLPVAAVISSPSDGAAVASTTPTISGTGESGDTVRLTDGSGTTVCIAAIATAGTWECLPTRPLPQGLTTLSTLTTDPAGNEIPGSPIQITVDTAPPTAAVITSPTQGATVATTPTISGTGEAGVTVEVTDGLGTVACAATVASGRTWSCQPSQPLPAGPATLTPTATDPAGNTTPGAPVTIQLASP